MQLKYILYIMDHSITLGSSSRFCEETQMNYRATKSEDWYRSEFQLGSRHFPRLRVFYYGLLVLVYVIHIFSILEWIPHHRCPHFLFWYLLCSRVFSSEICTAAHSVTDTATEVVSNVREHYYHWDDMKFVDFNVIRKRTHINGASINK